MTEERQQAYLELVQQLLNCESGQEPEILAAQIELVDKEGLVAMALEVAQMLEEREGSEVAGTVAWLRGFAENLAQELGLSSRGSNPENQLESLMNVLRAVCDSEGDPHEVYPVLKQNLELLDESLIELLQDWAQETFAELEPKKVRSIAGVIGDFGNLVQDFPLGNKAINMDLAIVCYEILTGVFTISTGSEVWASTQNNRANAYLNRIKGNRSENLEIAISGYDSSLQVYTREDFPIDWAGSKNNRASAYRNRIKGNRSENLEIAISGYDSSLQVYTREDFPIQWAITHDNRASAYLDRIKGNRSENLEIAISGYNSALEVRTREDFPIQWAMTQDNRASAYRNRIKGDRSENLELAISGHNSALEVRTQEKFPVDWAGTQNNRANAYFNRIKGDRSENLELAISGFDSALQVYTREDFPIQWAMAQDNRASAYRNRIKGDRSENLELAISGYDFALQVRTREDFPIQWAMTQDNRASAYLDRIKGDRSENLELAISGYNSALKVRTRENSPLQWAITQNNRANAYLDRIKGDRSENLELAISGYDSALQVRTRENFPIDWASTQNNRASAYSDRIKGDLSENLELAIAGFNSALQIYTREKFPVQWAMTQNNLASAYLKSTKGDLSENLEFAIAGFDSALQVRTREDFPIDWATTQNNRASAYLKRTKGDLPENLELAITGFDSALQVYTREDFPVQWAMTQNNHAIACNNRIKGDRAKNLELAIAGFDSALQVRTRESFPIDCRTTSRSLGNIHFDQQSWQAAAKAYDNALSAAEILYQSCILLDSKTSELTENADLCHRMTYALAHTGDLTKAIETIERSRARSLTESLDRDRADLDRLQQQNPTLYNQYKNLNQELRNLEAQQRDRMVSATRHDITPETLRDSATTLRQNLDELVQAIRQVPGYAEFLALPTFAEIQNAVQPDRPLVYLITTSAGGLALILQPEKIEPVWLNDFTSDQITTLLQTWFDDSQQFPQNRQVWYNTIDNTTCQLWAPLMAPIIQKLQEMKCDRATLIPTGYLSFFPLHAAWIPDETKPTGRRYALDELQIAYAPNAKSLIAAQRIADHITNRNILTIDNPTGDLTDFTQEIDIPTTNSHDHVILRHTAATVEAVRSKLPTSAIVHFHCHGTAILDDPLNSGLLMNKGLLTLKDIFALNLSDRGGIRLAILAACETGVIGTKNPDEAVSLPTGLLQAGVAGVIASLWTVFEHSTMLLIAKFYDLWQQDQDLSFDQALHQAQIWLRDTTNEKKLQEVKACLPEFGDSRHFPESLARDLYNKLAWNEPQDLEFAHPFHWSGFSYTGR